MGVGENGEMFNWMGEIICALEHDLEHPDEPSIIRRWPEYELASRHVDEFFAKHPELRTAS